MSDVITQLKTEITDLKTENKQLKTALHEQLITSIAIRSDDRKQLTTSLREAFNQRIKYPTNKQIFESLNKINNK
jgi:hypothetical protein